jgi:hypothetical protein
MSANVQGHFDVWLIVICYLSLATILLLKRSTTVEVENGLARGRRNVSVGTRMMSARLGRVVGVGAGRLV